MATGASANPLAALQKAPLRGPALVVEVIIVWLAGALYCSGYEALSTGVDNWPGSLVWSAVAILPWLALFEWSKSRSGRRRLSNLPRVLAVLVGVGAISLAAGRLIGAADGHSTPLMLSLLRRLPAGGTCLLLILWSRAGSPAEQTPLEAGASLSSLAASIDWIEAADNYVELHIAGRTVMRRMTMRNAERSLAGCGFIRIHRRFLVNGRRIAAVSGANGDRVVRLGNGTELPVGRAFAANLAQAA